VTGLPIGLIGIVKDDTLEQRWESLAKIAEMGYRGVEGGEFLLEGNAEENLKRFHGLGLKVLTVSSLRESLKDELDDILRKVEALQSPKVSMWWAPSEDLDEIRRDCELYNAAGKRIAEAGAKLCYHNHAHEFRSSFRGVSGLDVIAYETDPSCVFFELDIAWIAVGGEDPTRVIRRYKGRVPAIHVKDVVAAPIDEPEFTAVGTGVVDFVQPMIAAQECGVEWAVVEQDRLRNLNGLETAAAAIYAIREKGLAIL
jgi:sugar phosphate isomerase/epimerase